MNWDKFIKKEVTLERILIGVGLILFAIVMVFYYMGFLGDGEDFKQSSAERSEVLEEDFSMEDFWKLFEDEQEEEEVIEEVQKVVENIEEVIVDDMDYPSAEFIQCLADAGMIIYGSSSCGACASLAEQFGGYDAMSPIYVECRDFQERCDTEKQVNYVPEVQINGLVFQDRKTLENFAIETGCEL